MTSFNRRKDWEKLYAAVEADRDAKLREASDALGLGLFDSDDLTELAEQLKVADAFTPPDPFSRKA